MMGRSLRALGYTRGGAQPRWSVLLEAMLKGKTNLFCYSWSMVSNMGEGVERGVRQRINVQEGLCWLGGVQGYKEDARVVWSEKGTRLWMSLLFSNIHRMTFLGATVVPWLSTWLKPKAKGEVLLTSLAGDFYHSYSWPLPQIHSWTLSTWG